MYIRFSNEYKTELKLEIKEKEYYLGLDILRVVLMLLGIVTHSKAYVGIFNPFYDINSFRNLYIEYISYFFEIFRMDTFFAISGFFSSYVLLKYGKNRYKKGRVKRVLYPFLSAYFLMIVFSIFYLENHSFLLVHHLWFLVTLIIYSVLDYVLDVDGLLTRLEKRKKLIIIYILSIFILSYLLMFLYKKTESELFGLFIYDTFKYLNFYLLGKYFYLKRDMISSLGIPKIAYVITVILLGMSIYLYDLRYNQEVEGLFFLGSRTVLKTITSVCVVFLLFRLTINIKGKPKKYLSYLVQSSLVIYIFHYPFLLFIGLNKNVSLLMPNSWVYFGFLLIVTFLFTILTFEVLKKNKYTRLLFGIK